MSDFYQTGTVATLHRLGRIAMDIGFTSPPFGLLLFVFKGIAPDDISMPDIYKAVIPFILCNLITIILILVFPNIVIYVTDTIKH